MLSKIDKTKPPMPVIFGVEGFSLSKDEKSFFKDADPAGFILFARNVDTPQQVKTLVSDLKNLLGRDVAILIDQEGGRVQRLTEPNWRAYPSANSFSGPVMRNFADGVEDLKASMKHLAQDLYLLGINVNCAPVLDIDFPETHESIGDRCFSNNPQLVGLMAAATCVTFFENGVMPVVKHMPGQGRAQSDSHHELPMVDASIEEMEKTDFLPYSDLMRKTYSEAVWGMVAHVIYKDIDMNAPASCSRKVIYEVIRDKLEFPGILLSDDICMGALRGYGEHQYRAEKSIRAGCDIVLHCNGNLDHMKAVADRIPSMRENTVTRYNKSAAWLNRNAKKAA